MWQVAMFLLSLGAYDPRRDGRHSAAVLSEFRVALATLLPRGEAAMCPEIKAWGCDLVASGAIRAGNSLSGRLISVICPTSEKRDLPPRAAHAMPFLRYIHALYESRASREE